MWLENEKGGVDLCRIIHTGQANSVGSGRTEIGIYLEKENCVNQRTHTTYHRKRPLCTT